MFFLICLSQTYILEIKEGNFLNLTSRAKTRMMDNRSDMCSQQTLQRNFLNWSLIFTCGEYYAEIFFPEYDENWYDPIRSLHWHRLIMSSQKTLKRNCVFPHVKLNSLSKEKLRYWSISLPKSTAFVLLSEFLTIWQLGYIQYSWRNCVFPQQVELDSLSLKGTWDILKIFPTSNQPLTNNLHPTWANTNRNISWNS